MPQTETKVEKIKNIIPQKENREIYHMYIVPKDERSPEAPNATNAIRHIYLFPKYIWKKKYKPRLSK